MPIYLDIQPRLDDRAAKRAADDATKHFSDASKTVAQQFSENLSRALSSSDEAFRKSGETAEKAYKRAADAAGAARVEEAKLEDLRTKGTGGTALLAQSEKLEKARRAEASTTQSAVIALRALNDAQDAAGASAGRLHKELSDLTTGALASGTFLRRQDITQIGGILGGLSTKAVAATAGIAGIAVGVGVASKALYDLGATWDNIGDNITGRTGKIGTDLTAIVNTVQQVGKQSAISLEDIGKFAGGVSQSLHLTGAEATAMTQRLSDIQQVTKQVVDTKDLGKAFRLFDITDVQTEISTLGQLTAASQATNVPINELVTSLTTTGKASKEAGLNLQQTLGVMLSLEESGVSFDRAGSAITRALTNWAKQGIDANQALAQTITQIKTLIDAGNEPGAEALAAKVFGAKTGWVDFFNAIKDGTLDVNTLTDGLTKLTDTVEQQKKSQEDAAEGWSYFLHGAESALKPIGDFLFSKLNQPLLLAQQNVQGLSDKFSGLSGEIAGVKVSADLLATSLGLPGMPGAPPKPAGPQLPFVGPNQPGGGTGPASQSNTFYSDWYPKPDKPKTGLPTAPAVAYDTTLPPGYAGVPQTAEMVGAENSWMDARHTLAEKQARLDQLENDHNAKADDITKAKNDVINAQQGQTQAELKLNDARQSLYEKSTKQIKGYADQMGQIGVALDKDLGLSKGLPGLADNLVRFIGSLAAAPLLGPLAAISAAQGGINATGSGLVGIAAAQGAFGQQYTPAGMAASAAASGSGRSGSGPSAVLNPDGTVSMQQVGPGRGGTNALSAALAPLVGPGGPGTSPNGFPLLAPEQGFNVNGVSAQAASGAPAQRLQEFAKWFNDNIEPVKQLAGFDAGGHGLGNRSNHTSGTALDINWDDFTALQGHGADARTHFSAEQMQAISQQLTQTGMTWGQYWTPDSRDPGHFELSGAPYSRNGPQNVGPTTGQPASPTGGPGPGAPGGQNWDALAAKESSGNWNTDTGNGYYGGLQFDQSTWAQYGGTGNPAQASKDEQIAVAQRAMAARGGPQSLWPQNYGQLQAPGFASGGGVDTVPAMLAPGEHVLTANDVKALGGQSGVYAFRNALHRSTGGEIPPYPSGPGSYSPGTNPLNVIKGGTPTAPAHGTPGPPPVAIQNLPPGAQPGTPIAPGPPLPPVASGQGTGNAPGPSPIGGSEPKNTPGGAPSGGGLAGAATGAAAMAADMFAPGSGAAIQIASQEAQRAIKFAGQATAIGVGGLMETFLPTGASDLANNSWITRIASGFAGVQPQIPNLAGKSASVDAMQQKGTPPMALPPPISGTAPPAGGPQVVNNIQYHNNGVANDPNVGTLGDHLVRQYENMPGQR